MAFKKGESGNPSGRPLGCKNKVTKAKEDYFKAYAKIGGMACLVKLLEGSNQSKKEFLLKVLPTLMPKELKGQIGGDGGEPIQVNSTTEIGPVLREVLDGLIEDLQGGQESPPTNGDSSPGVREA